MLKIPYSEAKNKKNKKKISFQLNKNVDKVT